METKFGGIGGNLTWRMQGNVNFGGNLIWRMIGKHVFWRELNLTVSTKLNKINAFFIKKWYSIYFFANNQDKTKRKT